MVRYPVIIPHIKRNDNLLEIIIPYLRLNVTKGNIYVVGSKDTIASLFYGEHNDIIAIDEDNIIEGLTFENIKRYIIDAGIPERRTGWYFQQFLKMAWSLKNDCSEKYFVWDSDTIPLKAIQYFNENGEQIFFTTRQYHESYFKTMEQLIGKGKVVDGSFIAESMLIDREHMRNLLNLISARASVPLVEVFRLILTICGKSNTPSTAFSEFETYGTYVTSLSNVPHTIAQSNGFRNGAKLFGLKPNKYDLYRLSKKHSIVSFERWNTIIWPFVTVQKLVSLIYYGLDKIMQGLKCFWK